MANIEAHKDALFDVLSAANEILNRDQEALKALIAEQAPAPEEKIKAMDRKVSNLSRSVLRLNAFV